MMSSKPHAALLSSPGLGHLIPVLELGKRLVTHHNFQVTVLVIASHTSPAESQVIESAMSPKLFDIVQLPPPDISSLVDAKTTTVSLLSIMMREVRPAFRSSISAMKSRPTILIADLFGTEFFPIAYEFQMLKYVYIASNAWFLAMFLYSPILDKEVEGEYEDQKEPFIIPGCRSLRPHEVFDAMLDRNNQQYHELIRMGIEIPLSDGILLNIWEDLEPTTLAALRDESLLGQIAKVPIYTVGPLRRSIGSTSSTSQLFEWLDKQPNESVIYVSFGSGGSLSHEQTIELAWGLELSQQKFIWVVRPPATKGADAAFFTVGGGENDVSEYLPEGFLSRTHKLGIVVPMWAPQVDILSHDSVGGFLSHCGWNSTIESITSAVPMIAWPLYAEQRMNATLLNEEFGVAVRSKVLPTKEVVGREEIETVVRKIMEDNQEGNVIRARVKQLKRDAEKALSEGGSSNNQLSQVAEHREIHMQRMKVKD